MHEVVEWASLTRSYKYNVLLAFHIGSIPGRGFRCTVLWEQAIVRA